MNATPGSVGMSSLLSTQPTGMDEPAPESLPDADFTAALAAAIAPAEVDKCAEIVESIMPEDLQSAPALAWMAGLLSSEVPRRAVPANNADLPDDGVAGTMAQFLAQPQMLVTEAMAAAAEFAAQLVATDADDAAPDAQSVVASTLIKAGAMRAGGEAGSPQTADPIESAVLLAQLQGDHSKLQTISAVGRLLNALPDQSAAGDLPTLRLDTSGSAQALYTSARETSVATAPGPVAQEALRQPVGTPRWGAELGTRLMLMSVRGQQEGSLSLTPEHLGPLEIRINVSQDTTSVWFGAQHADTRAALTEALPRLRELFAASGLALGHAGVSHEMPRHEARRAEASAMAVRGSDDGSDVAATSPMVRRLQAVLLDAWA